MAHEAHGPAAVEDRLRCERECSRLCMEFAWAVDRNEYDAFVALFAADGVFERPGLISRGHDEIRRFLDSRPRDRVTRHLCTNVRTELTAPTRATGTCSALMYQATTSRGTQGPLPASPPLVIDYADDYVLTTSGWKFSHRRTAVVFEQRDR